MAYMSQERKAQRAPVIKAILKRYGVKGTLAVRNHSTLVLNIKSGKIDFIKNFEATRAARPEYLGDRMPHATHLSINPYWFHEHFTGDALSFLTEVFAALKGDDYFDETDAQIDYFHTSHYCDVNIGQWNKPYELTK
jgi:hypothetical protein